MRDMNATMNSIQPSYRNALTKKDVLGSSYARKKTSDLNEPLMLDRTDPSQNSPDKPVNLTLYIRLNPSSNSILACSLNTKTWMRQR